MSLADSVVWAIEEVAWEEFLEVLGLDCWHYVAFLALCSQKLTFGGAGVLWMTLVGWVIPFSLFFSFSTLFLGFLGQPRKLAGYSPSHRHHFGFWSMGFTQSFVRCHLHT
ncbi:hypothetical protein TNIN_90561 [Trichonephila inaurata madagascariensis]|uniref:Uncharacterized protein n=1 Tax=Trichonephila inaurata madagascariensis TaxID=2747483 RepID=A0A8X6YN80_9ARAC|nr:hypothetical protein TNIN_90561 [Trichonephila inaurata madagascariensis]